MAAVISGIIGLINHFRVSVAEHIKNDFLLTAKETVRTNRSTTTSTSTSTVVGIFCEHGAMMVHSISSFAEEDLGLYAYKYQEKQGIAVIINNRAFKPSSKNLPVRNTTKDKQYLKLRLKHFNFDVQEHEDLTAEQMKDVLNKAAALDHTNNACFMCIMMSYGEDGIIYGTDAAVQVQHLLDPFKGNKCHSLVTKPKIFIIQASPIPRLEYQDSYETEVIPRTPTIKRIPIEADFFISYSVVPDFLPYNKSKEYDGSWFIQAICEVFKAPYSKKLDLMSLFTKVNRLVVKLYQKNAEKDFRKGKNIPCITSMLVKEFYFNVDHPEYKQF